MRFTVKPKLITLGKRKGETGYQAVPETASRVSLDRLIEIVVDETSLGAGDARNAIITMTKIVRRYLSDGVSIDMGELGSFRVNVSSKVLSNPKEVTAAKALNKPKIVYTPKQDLREAVAEMKLQVVNPYRQADNQATPGSDTPEPGTDDPGTGDQGGTGTIDTGSDTPNPGTDNPGTGDQGGTGTIDTGGGTDPDPNDPNPEQDE